MIGKEACHVMSCHVISYRQLLAWTVFILFSGLFTLVQS